jgi:transcriptional regulator GlxA family with amidase domain
MTRTIVCLLFEGFQILDAAGPLSAFEAANTLKPNTYKLRVCAVQPGLVASSSGVAMLTEKFPAARSIDTLLVVGGGGVKHAAVCKRTRTFVQKTYNLGLRVASVCSGAYVLATAGLLDGKRATTHWSRSRDFAARFPKVKLESDRIYINDNNLWTSAGISAGIDLALALITADVGEKMARQVAQELVVYYRRPGGQSQFSPLLDEAAGGRFEGLLDYVRSHLTSNLSVDSLAERVGMSPRHFSRVFAQESGMGPAQAVQRIRAETARVMLEGRTTSLKDTAHRCGFGTTEHLRRTIQRYGSLKR